MITLLYELIDFDHEIGQKASPELKTQEIGGLQNLERIHHRFE